MFSRSMLFGAVILALGPGLVMAQSNPPPVPAPPPAGYPMPAAYPAPVPPPPS